MNGRLIEEQPVGRNSSCILVQNSLVLGMNNSGVACAAPAELRVGGSMASSLRCRLM